MDYNCYSNVDSSCGLTAAQEGVKPKDLFAIFIHSGFMSLHMALLIIRSLNGLQNFIFVVYMFSWFCF